MKSIVKRRLRISLLRATTRMTSYRLRLILHRWALHVATKARTKQTKKFADYMGTILKRRKVSSAFHAWISLAFAKINRSTNDAHFKVLLLYRMKFLRDGHCFPFHQKKKTCMLWFVSVRPPFPPFGNPCLQQPDTEEADCSSKKNSGYVDPEMVCGFRAIITSPSRIYIQTLSRRSQVACQTECMGGLIQATSFFDRLEAKADRVNHKALLCKALSFWQATCRRKAQLHAKLSIWEQRQHDRMSQKFLRLWLSGLRSLRFKEGVYESCAVWYDHMPHFFHELIFSSHKQAQCRGF